MTLEELKMVERIERWATSAVLLSLTCAMGLVTFLTLMLLVLGWRTLWG